MLRNTRKDLRKSRKAERKMSSAETAQELIRSAFPTTRHGSVKASVWACYDRFRRHYAKVYPELANTTQRRIETLWQATARRVDWFEIAALQEENARRIAHENATRFQATAAHLRAVDAEFYSAAIAEIERAIAQTGADDSALD